MQNGGEPGADEALESGKSVSSETRGARKKGILEEILGEPVRIKNRVSFQYALSFITHLYRDGDIATALENISWTHENCRIGFYRCGELKTKPRRVGALVSMVPNHKLRPVGVEKEKFDQEIGASLRELVPAPDKALPYIPQNGEALLTFNDHYGLSRYLLLHRAGDTWRVIAIGSAEQLRG